MIFAGDLFDSAKGLLANCFVSWKNFKPPYILLHYFVRGVFDLSQNKTDLVMDAVMN